MMDNVTQEFESLVAQGKISKAKKVKTAKVNNFRILKGSKTIRYNSQMNQFSKEDIDFFLLHEEGHLKNPFKLIEWIILATIILIFYFLFWSGFGPLAMFFYLYSLHVFLIERCQKYEYLADDFACKNIDNPREGILALNRIKTTNLKINKWLLYFLITLGVGYKHPPNEKRIQRIYEKYQ